jgi:ABC-type dipeptide/oligopeptide/nickel transport system permease component
MSVIKALFFIGPLLFGLAFLAPLTAQIIEHLAWTAPMGLTPLQFGLLLGGAFGALATWRGSWV